MGKAEIDQDRLRVPELRRQVALDIELTRIEQIRVYRGAATITYAGASGEPARHWLGSLPGSDLRRLRDAWQSAMEQKVVQDGALEGLIPSPDWASIVRPWIALVAFAIVLGFGIDAVGAASSRSDLSRPVLVFGALVFAPPLLLCLCLAGFYHYRQRQHRRWSGRWRIDHLGLQHGNGAGGQLEPTAIGPRDGYNGMLRYGGRKVPLRLFGGGPIVRDLLFCHLRRASRPIELPSFFPRIASAAIIPFASVSVYLTLAWAGVALEPRETRAVLGVALVGPLVQLGLMAWIRKLQTGQLSESLARCERLARELGW